jgi:anti-sigma B factor antagonist
MTITEVRNDEELQLNISGKIDTITATDFQKTVLTSFQKSNKVILNFKDVTYISSAGLRALVLGEKTAASKGGSMKLINTNDSIMDILRITGMDKMLNIE